MGAELAIRRYRPDDRERVEAVLAAALRDTGAYYEEEPDDADGALADEYLTSGGEFLVGEVTDHIVATGAFRPVRGVITNFLDSVGNGTAELKRMHVDPPHQRQGYGRRIFDELRRRARDQGYMELVLLTSGPQIAAQHFYEASGFEEIEREPVDVGGESFDAIVYRRPLSKSVK